MQVLPSLNAFMYPASGEAGLACSPFALLSVSSRFHTALLTHWRAGLRFDQTKVARNSVHCLDNRGHQNFILWNRSLYSFNKETDLQEAMVKLVLLLIMTNFISMWASWLKECLESGQRQKGVYDKKDLAPSGSWRGLLLLFVVLHVILSTFRCRVESWLHLYRLHKF